MKLLQVALDLFDVNEALDILDQVAEYVDIIEIGTPLIISEGAKAVKVIKENYPDKIVFADIKVMDGGSEVPKSVLDAGADMISVLAVSRNETIKAAIEFAHKHKAKVLVDMCAVKDIKARANEIDIMSPDFICVHVGYDIQQTSGLDPIEELKKLDGVNCKKAIAGGIKLDTFKKAVESSADDIICGGGILKQKDMKDTARQMREIIDKYNLQ